MSGSSSDPNRTSEQIKNKQRTCYLSAAPQINLKALVDVLEEKGMTPALTSALRSTATTFPGENIRAISRANLFIALLSSTEENANVYFEPGIAMASEVRTLLIAPMDIHLTPRRMMLERGAHSNWAKKLVSSPRLREGLLPFLGMGADCRERRAR